MTTRRVLVIVCAALLGVALASSYGSHGNAFSYAAPIDDFEAFYCAGAAVAARSDPYAAEPLHVCEKRLGGVSLPASLFVESAPLPPYDLAAFALLSRLPYALARPLFSGILFVALLLSTWYLAALSRQPRLLVFGAMCLVAGYVPLMYGQLTPIVLAALSAAAFYADRHAWGPLAVALAMTAIEPNLATVAWLASFIWFPRTRLPLAAIATVLAGAGIAAIGLSQSLEYFSEVLPEQAQAEIVAVSQFSLSHVLHVLGVADNDAMRIGAVSFAIATVVGLVVARRARYLTGSDGLLVALPPVAVLAGGSALHEFQVIVAFPAAFLLATRLKNGAAVAWCALILLVFPWYSFSTVPFALFVPAFAVALWTAGTLAYIGAHGLSQLSRVLLSAGAAFGCFVLVLAFRHLPGPDVRVAPRGPIAHASISASLRWGEYLRATPGASASSWQKELEKLPPWLALSGLIVVAATARPRETAMRRDETPSLLPDAAT